MVGDISSRVEGFERMTSDAVREAGGAEDARTRRGIELSR